ncbi:hypothetical protein AXG93_2982s1050 [Marchantia polymorpha subsp. ruderalis]|uniref:Uncharacterized protein n=1 Tax=Marchantia polymorpha subsp. ruderalis TaxID=1480154 RepID=A0A176VZG2_MARPO|nr:hypothetical protein AXG93_2982s1050 [Marchantia polymorpha subsp. ruderalis]
MVPGFVKQCFSSKSASSTEKGSRKEQHTIRKTYSMTFVEKRTFSDLRGFWKSSQGLAGWLAASGWE